MITLTPLRALLGLALLVLGQSTHAVAVAGPNGTESQGMRMVPALPAPSSGGTTHELITARIEAVDPAKGTLTLRGRAVPVVSDRLQVFGSAGAVAGGLRALRPGQNIRFALEPHTAATQPRARASGPAQRPGHAASRGVDAAPQRRIVLIYID
jgi:hypothetical protein